MGRNRLLSAAGVALFVAGLHGAAPERLERERWLHLLALPLGYGHLLGALVSARRRLGAAVAPVPPLLAGAFATSLLLTLLVLYASALHHPGLGPLVVVALLALSAWHIVENDLALGRAYRAGLVLEGGPPPPGVRGKALGGVGVLFLLALATPEGAALARRETGWGPPFSPLSLTDLATGVLLYHAATWAIFFLQRAGLRSPGERRRARGLLLWVHVLPLGVNSACTFWAEPVFALLSMPTLYLFWSAAHVVQTSWMRSGAVSAAAARAPV